jgi:hypothetical protein
VVIPAFDAALASSLSSAFAMAAASKVKEI